MNKEWISRRHNSARYFRSEHHPPNTNKNFIRILDAVGMFETGWLIYDHSYGRNRNRYGYPN